MTQDQPDDGVVPGWPPLSASADENSFSVRAFGLGPCDLDLDFADTRPADLVNRLLAATLRRRDGRGFQKAELWSWTLGRRVQGLLAMAVATRGRNLTLQTSCDDPDCDAFIELELDLTAFAASEHEKEFDFQPDPDTEIRVRLPTGKDQRDISEAPAGNLGARELASRLVTRIDGEAPGEGWVVPAAWLDGMAAELERHDPLMNLVLRAACPACGAALAFEFDLEAELLGLISGEQARLLDEIHRLAAAYHWSEADIVKLPPFRRRYYLTRLEGAAGP